MHNRKNDKTSIAEQFRKEIAPIVKMIVSNKIQNQELIQLRDFLLALLMNGQVKVK